MLGVTGIFAVAGIFKTIAGVPAVINDPNDASAPAVVHFPAIAGFPSDESASAITDFTIVYDISCVAGGVVGSSLLFLVLLLLLASLLLLAVLILLPGVPAVVSVHSVASVPAVELSAYYYCTDK
jgi:hypothetical protein